jgi:hypothetical protein
VIEQTFTGECAIGRPPNSRSPASAREFFFCRLRGSIGQLLALLIFANVNGTCLGRFRELFIWAGTVIDVCCDSRGFIFSDMVKSGRYGLRQGISLAQMRTYTWEPENMPYSSNLGTLFLYSGIGIKGKARDTGTLGLLDQNPFGILSRYWALGILGSLDGPLLLEFARLKGRHVGQLWALLQILFECSN